MIDATKSLIAACHRWLDAHTCDDCIVGDLNDDDTACDLALQVNQLLEALESEVNGKAESVETATGSKR